MPVSAPETGISPRKRYGVIDTLRGFAVVNMILYHLLWNLVHFCGFAWAWFDSLGVHIWQQFICYSFVLLSGFCFSLSKRPLYHGIKVFTGGLSVTLVTVILMPGARVVFGILTLLGTCSLLLVPVAPYLRKIYPVLGLSLAASLFFLTRNVCYGYLGFEGLNICPLPAWLYRNTVTAFLGFPHGEFFSTDYFPLLPWLFLFLMGFFLFGIFEKHRLFYVLEREGLPLLDTAGRHAFLVYLLHQPVLYAVCILLFG